MVSAVIGRAMAEQVKRVNKPKTLAEALTWLEDQQQLIDSLRAQLRQHQRHVDTVEIAGQVALDGRPVGTQSDYARHWNIPTYTVSRWCKGALDKKENRSAPKLQTVMRNGHQLVYMDQSPPVGKRGRKKSR